MGRLERILLLVLACCFALAIPADAVAQEGRWRASPPPDTAPPKSTVDEARRRYQKALKLYEKEGAVDAALAEMQRAYDLAPSYKILYNLGQVARTARDYALALHTFRRYLADGGTKVDKQRRAKIAKEIKELETYVAAVTVTVDVPGATIHLDDVEVGVSPLDEPVMVNAGRARIRAVKGSSQNSKTIGIAGGDEITVSLSLGGGGTASTPDPDDPDDPEPTPDDPDPVSDEPRASNPNLWIGWVATGAFAAGATITGILALTASSDLGDELYAGTEPPESLTDQQDTITALAITTDVLIGAAVVSLTVTGLFAILGVGEEPVSGETTEASWTLAPIVPNPAAPAGAAGSDGWGLAVVGRF
ncbi:MAG: tetratricopeptide repeat protein [Deltaproteobacteria bacterium]|nr:tetratricopeptide repeat protein [Deltaproteobacteria bacterium]